MIGCGDAFSSIKVGFLEIMLVSVGVRTNVGAWNCDQWWWIGYADGCGYAGGCSFEGTKVGLLSHAIREHTSFIFYIGACIVIGYGDYSMEHAITR